MTDEAIAVTIARIDERLGTMMDGQSALKNEVALLHDTAIRFGNSLERTRQEMVFKADCTEHTNVITSMIPCKDGNCAWEVHGKATQAENRAVRISIKEGFMIALFTVPIVLLTTVLTNLFHLAK